MNPAQTTRAAATSPDHARPQADATWLLLFGSWLIATASTLGALYFSDVMDMPPCVLCWYQRIAMFPLVLLLPAGLFPLDPRVVRYTLPLALAGCGVALFHVLLVAGVIPEEIRPCSQGVPCADSPVIGFGFVTIPLLSLVAFGAIAALLVLAHFRSSK
jgi:disulfide bond formation protein DsbB